MPEQPATGTFDEGAPAGVAAGSFDAGPPAELAFAGRGFVGGLPTSRDVAAARAAARADAEALRAAGLEVIREKVEAVSTNDGVPATPAARRPKVVAEYLCFDSNRAVDDGWLEPLPEPSPAAAPGRAGSP